MFANASRSLRLGAALLVVLTGALLVSHWSSLHASQAAWIDTFGGLLSGSGRTFATASDVAVDAQGYAYVAGSTTVALAGQTNAGQGDAFVRKYDTATGAMLWTREFGDATADTEGHAVAIHQTPSGVEVYVAGRLNSRVSLWKYDGDGNALWTWTLDGTSQGSGQAYDVAIDAAGAPVVVGDATVDGVPLGVVAHVSPDGVSPSRSYLGSQSGGEVGVTSAAFTSAGRLVLGGYTNGPLMVGGEALGPFAGERDAFLLQTGAGDGLTAEWSAQFGSATWDMVESIAIGPDDSVYAVGVNDYGVSQGGSFVRKYDRSGTMLWSGSVGPGPAGGVKPTYCDVSVNPASGSVHILGTNDLGVGRLFPCLTSTSLPGYYGAGASTNFSMFIHSFDADGHELAKDVFNVPAATDEWTEDASGNLPTGHALAQVGDSLVFVGNTQTYNFTAHTCPQGVEVCPAAYGGDYAFVSRRDRVPRGLIELRQDSVPVTLPNRPVTITGTYHDPNGVTPVISSNLQTVVQTGGATGTWSITYSPHLTGLQTIPIRADDDTGTLSTLDVEVNVEVPAAPLVYAYTSAVVVQVGRQAVMTGTYEVPSGTTPNLRATSGTLTSSGGATGTWLWVGQTSVVGTQTVVITAEDWVYDSTGSAAFQVSAIAQAPTVVVAQASTVVVGSGQTATNSGTYFNPSGSRPTLTASTGTLTQGAFGTGTWNWSNQNTNSSSTVTISANGEAAASFDLVVQTSSITVSSSVNPSLYYWEPVDFTATLASLVPGLPPPTGTIQFAIDGTVLNTVALDHGVASIHVDPRVLGVHSLELGTRVIEAIYAGDGTHGPSRGSMTQTVVPEGLAYDSAWVHQFGNESDDRADGVATDSHRLTFAVGTWNGQGFLRMWSYAGDDGWTRFLTTPGTHPHAVAVDVDPVGYVYVVGEASGALPGQTASGGRDMFITQYSKVDGVEGWTRQFGSAADDVAYAVTVDAAGRVTIAGTTYDQLPGQIAYGGVDAFVRQYDREGNELWTRQFGTNTTDELFAIAADGTGGVVATGYTGGTLPGETLAGIDDVIVARWDSSGTLSWMRQFGTSSRERGQGVAIDAAGGIYVAGTTDSNLPGQTSAGSVDAFLRKYDVAGVEQWTRQFGTSSLDNAYGVAVGPGAVTVGGGTDGAFPGFTALGGRDGFVQSFTSSGSSGPAQQFGSAGNDVATAVTTDALGRAIVAGYTDGAIGGATPGGSTSAGLNDAFVAHLVDEAHPTVIVVQPVSQTAVNGSPVVFEAVAASAHVNSLKWQRSTDGGSTFADVGEGERFIDPDYVGGVRARFSLSADLLQSGSQYRAVFLTAFGYMASDAATLTVRPADIVLTGGNASVTVLKGRAASNLGTYADVNGTTPTLTASVGTIVTTGAASGTWTWVLATTVPIASELVTITATDTTGATGTTAFPLTVLDDQAPPVITTAGDITAEATFPGGALVTFTATATDDDGAVPVACAPVSGSIFPLGATSVTCTATDAAGNGSAAAFIVTVVDTTAPVLSIQNYDADSISDGWPALVRVQASDAVGVTSVKVNDVPATLIEGSPQSGVWESPELPTDAWGFGFYATALDAGGRDGYVDFWADGDGIAAVIDKGMENHHPEDLDFTDDFDKDEQFTRGRIEDRGAFRVFIEDVPGTPSVRARVEGSRFPDTAARIMPCFPGSHKQVRLDVGIEQAIWSCATGGTITITAEVAKPTIDVFKAGCVSGSYCPINFLAALSEGDTLTTGSPFVADPANQHPIVVTMLDAAQAPIGSFSLDPGESADVTPAAGNDLLLTTLAGEVEFTVKGQAVTLGENDPPVIVSGDQLPPVIAQAGSVTAEATSSAGAAVSFALPAVSDDADPAPVVSASPASGSLFPLGSTVVTVTAIDAAGHSSSTTFVVTVQDTTPPLIVTSGDVTAEAVSNSQTGGGTQVTFSVTATDLVDGGPTLADCDADTNTLFQVGATQVNCTSTDTHGNVGTATFTVTIVDTTPPHVLTSGDVTIEAQSPAGEIFTFQAVGIDIVDVGAPATCDPVSGTRFPLGATMVTCTATDDAGNTGMTTFTVTVADTTSPAIVLPAPIVIDSATGGGVPVTYEASALDLLDGARPVACEPASGSTFALGTTTVVCTSSDTRGNTGTAELTVTVVDRTVPVVTTSGDVTVEATTIGSTPVSFSASAIDPLDGTLPVVCFPESGHGFGLGTTTVTCTATDAAGNIGSATLDVTVTDTTAPALTLPSPIAVGATTVSGAPVTYAASALDLGLALDATCSPESGSVFPIGQTVVNCSAHDRTGNTANGSFAVTVTAAPPVIAPLGGVTAEATSAAGAVVTFALPVVSDALDPAPVVTALPAAGSLFAIGHTTVTITATSATGQHASATFVVTVRDTTAPVLTVPDPMTVEASGPGGAAVTFAATATDAVSAATTVCTPASGATFPVGTTTVTCTATDTAGNAATRTFTIEVTDESTPGLMHGGGHVMSGPVQYDFNFSVLELANGRSWGWFKLQVCQPAPPKHRGRAHDDERRRDDEWRRRGENDDDDDDRNDHDFEKHDNDEYERCVGGRNRFTAWSRTDSRFSNDPAFVPGHGRSQRSLNDTVFFSGTGSWNGAPGYRYEVRATDRGEPGKGRDGFAVTIRTPNGATVVASAQGTLTSGNVQSSPGFNRGWGFGRR